MDVDLVLAYLGLVWCLARHEHRITESWGSLVLGPPAGFDCRIVSRSLSISRRKAGGGDEHCCLETLASPSRDWPEGRISSSPTLLSLSLTDTSFELDTQLQPLTRYIRTYEGALMMDRVQIWQKTSLWSSALVPM
jgi:hypothetical protein